MNTFDIANFDTGERMTREDAPKFDFYENGIEFVDPSQLLRTTDISIGPPIADEAVRIYDQEKADIIPSTQYDSQEVPVPAKITRKESAFVSFLGRVGRNAYHSGRLLHP
jgi:hypothetical protein